MLLLGQKVLVTRPEGQADKLINFIIKEGGVAYHYPALVIKPIDPILESKRTQICRQITMELDNFQQVIFISTNAVRFGMQWIHNFWPQLPVGINWHGIGRSTVGELQKAGVEVEGALQLGYEPMNSEALLLQPILQHIKDEKILIVRGVQGREHLRTSLIQRGAIVRYLECYHRVEASSTPDPRAQELASGADIICVNSGDSLKSLCKQIGHILPVILDKQIVVPSQRVANIATQQGFNKPYVAQNASDEATLNALLALTRMNK